MQYIEAPDVEEEVKRLLRMDSTAIKIRWEVLAEEDVKDDKNDDSLGSPPHGNIPLLWLVSVMNICVLHLLKY